MSIQTKVKELIEYLGGPTKASRALGVSQATASNWSKGRHGMLAAKAIKAEIITDGAFRAHELNESLANIGEPDQAA